MQPNNSDEDLLKFRDFPFNDTNGGGGSNSTSPAEITVNSPTHGASYGGGASGSRIRSDPLAELMYDMNDASRLSDVVGSMHSGIGGKHNDSTDGFTVDDSTTNSKGTSILSIEYYQQFFNVDTNMVLERIANSMIPRRADGNYLRSNIARNPDLYGPFWINITLIFSIAVSGNIASYIQQANDSYRVHYNYRLISYAAVCIFIYAVIMPTALWGLFKYSLKPLPEEDLESEMATYTPSLLSLLCVYGYSLAIYVPVSILWVIQISLWQWMLVIVAAFLSGSSLVCILIPALRNSRYSLLIALGILAAHFLLAAGFMLYFFHVPDSAATSNNADAITVAAHKALKQTTLSPVVGNIVTENVTKL